MQAQTIITGNLTADPELRFTAQGTPVVGFTIASTARAFNRAAGKWEDGETVFMRCTAWRDLAEHVSESLHKGQQAIVVGRLAQRTYADREGIERTVTELQVDEVGVSLRFGTAQFTRRGQRGAAYSPQDGDAETGTSQAGPGYDAENPWGFPAVVN